MQSIKALLAEYFGLISAALIGATLLLITIRKSAGSGYAWLPILILNLFWGFALILASLPGLGARGPDAIGMVFLLIPISLGLLHILSAGCLAVFRPKLRILPLLLSSLSIAGLAGTALLLDKPLERTAVIEVLDEESNLLSVQAGSSPTFNSQIKVDRGRIVVNFPYRTGFIPIVLERSDGSIADIYLSYVGVRSGVNGYLLSESEVVDGMTVEEQSHMEFKIKPQKWKRK